MRGKYFVAALATVTAFLALASQAEAEILSLDCSGPLGTTEAIWVDIDKSVITEKFPNGSIQTQPATITATSISWKRTDSCCTWTNEIDRTSGDFHYSGLSNANNQYFPGSHFQCVKGTTPLPATKF